MIRNITFDSRSVGVSPTSSTAPPEDKPVTLRLRKVTVSPQEEYQLRDGEVRPISDELAAAILSFKGRAIIGHKGIVVDRKDIGGKWTYFHEHSVTLNDFSARERRLFYVINRQVPEVLHLLDENGCYIESVPLRERPAVLDQEAQQEQLRQNKAIVNRAAKRLQDLHADDTAEALETLAANSREMTRIVQTLPACSDPASPVQPPHRSTQGEIIADITHNTREKVSREKAAGSPTDIVSRRTRQTTCPF